MRARRPTSSWCALESFVTFAVAMVSIATVCPPRGLAQDGDADERARVLYHAGENAYRDSRYDDALGYFRRSHELSGRPELVFNIGSTLERLGRTREALDAYERFLRERPDADNRDLVEEKMAVLRESLQRGAAELEAEPPAAPLPLEPAGLGPWPYVALGGGALLGGAAGLFWLLATGAEDDLAQGCGATRSCSADAIDGSNGPAYVTLTNVFLVSSIAVLATGTALLIVDLASGDGDAETPSAEVGLGPGTLHLRGRF